MPGTSIQGLHPTISGLYVRETDINQVNSSGQQLVLTASFTGTLDVTASIYSHGCILTKTDTTTGQRAVYENVGSSAAPQWRLMSVPAQTTYLMVDVDTLTTNGTTPVSVFPGGAPMALTITSVKLIPKGAVGGVVQLYSTTNTKAFVVQNATTAYVVGATSILNASVASGENILIVASSAGTSGTVEIGFTGNNY